MKTAYFVRHPRTADELRRPHLLSAEREYEIVKTVTLGAMDYENFMTDMLADRQFIGDSAPLCISGEPVKCLLVRSRGCGCGVLVVPERGAFVGWAAYAGGE